MTALRNRQEITTARGLFDLWIDSAEEAYAAVALSQEFREVYGALGNAQMRLRAAIQIEVEHITGLFGMPTRTEIDSAHRKIAELERALRRAAAAGSRPVAERRAATQPPESFVQAPPSAPNPRRVARKPPASRTPAARRPAATQPRPAKKAAARKVAARPAVVSQKARPGKRLRQPGSGTPAATVAAPGKAVRKPTREANAAPGRPKQRHPCSRSRIRASDSRVVSMKDWVGALCDFRHACRAPQGNRRGKGARK